MLRLMLLVLGLRFAGQFNLGLGKRSFRRQFGSFRPHFCNF